MDPTLEQALTAFEEVGIETLRLVRHLGEAQADLPTDCPGWTVRDQLAHMVGLEQVLAGAPEPTVELPELTHVVTELDRYMERHVQVRRGLPLVAVADELQTAMARRVDQLRRLVAQGDPEVAAPMGNQRPLSVALPVRVLDLWAHEQDIRRAVGQPNRLTGQAPAVVIQRLFRTWSGVLPERAPDVDARLRVVARQVDAPSPDTDPPEVEIVLGTGAAALGITADVGVLAQLGCGRGDPQHLLALATVDGDPALAARIGRHLAFTP